MRQAPTPAMVAYGRVLSEPRLSPDGTRVAFVATASGRAQIVVVPAEGGPELVVTTDPEPPPAQAYGGGVFDWLPSGDRIIYAAVDGCLYTVSAGGGPSTLFAASVGQGAHLAAPSAAGAFVTCVQSGRSDDAVLLFEGVGGAAPPWPQLVASADFCFDPTVSAEGHVAWHEWSVPDMPWDGGLIRERRMGAPAGGSQSAPESGQSAEHALVTLAGEATAVSVGQPRYSPDGAWLACTSDASGWANVVVIHAGSAAAPPVATAPPPGATAPPPLPTGPTAPRPVAPESFEQADPAWGLGQRSFAWSPDGSKIAYQRNEGGFGRLVVVDVAGGERTEVSKGIHGGLSWRGGRLACIRSGARTPTHIAVFDFAGSGSIGAGDAVPVAPTRRVVARGPVGGWEEAGLVEPEVVHWSADDGAEVHGRLYRPPGVESPPMLCWVHGGPTSQWPVTFRERLAYFVAKGWAILVPDHRGSTGWGRAYTQAMREGWGDLDVHDTAAGIRHAAVAGWCDPRRVAIIGGSAGGFTVLGVLGRYPELCAAGVDLFGVADLLQIDEVTHRFEAHYNASLVGVLPAAVERYRQRSPVGFAERITAPLLILQGSADPVVPLSQSQAIADRLRSQGRVVEMHVFEGEGHGWTRPSTVLAEVTSVEDFLRRHVLRWRV